MIVVASGEPKSYAATRRPFVSNICALDRHWSHEVGVAMDNTQPQNERHDEVHGTRAPLLQGMTAVVTGGGAGIGAAIARRFAAHGATVEVGEIDVGAIAALSDEPAITATRSTCARARP